MKKNLATIEKREEMQLRDYHSSLATSPMVENESMNG
jgi:hypothetical protein